MHQVLNKYRVIFHQQFSTKQKIYHFATGLGGAPTFFWDSKSSNTVQLKIVSPPKYPSESWYFTNPNHRRCVSKDYFGSSKENNTHTYWNLPLFQATLLLLASSFKRCQVDPRFKHLRDVNHPSIRNLRQAGFIHNLLNIFFSNELTRCFFPQCCSSLFM